MRADTHVSFSVPAEEPKAKCTNSQANEINKIKQSTFRSLKIIFKNSDLSRFIRINWFYGCWICIGLHITCLSFNER